MLLNVAHNTKKHKNIPQNINRPRILHYETQCIMKNNNFTLTNTICLHICHMLCLVYSPAFNELQLEILYSMMINNITITQMKYFKSLMQNNFK